MILFFVNRSSTFPRLGYPVLVPSTVWTLTEDLVYITDVHDPPRVIQFRRVFNNVRLCHGFITCRQTCDPLESSFSTVSSNPLELVLWCSLDCGSPVLKLLTLFRRLVLCHVLCPCTCLWVELPMSTSTGGHRLPVSEMTIRLAVRLQMCSECFWRFRHESSLLDRVKNFADS